MQVISIFLDNCVHTAKAKSGNLAELKGIIL